MSEISSLERIFADAAPNDLSQEQNDRFRRQIEFVIEVDKLKHIQRQTILMDRSRRENSAEHSWHIALMVLILSEYAKDSEIDFLRVIQILLVHDLIEIDAGDTYCYDEKGRKDQAEREQKAAERVFSILPPDLAETVSELWNEFEDGVTPESKFANALDRFQPFLHNYFTKGQTWLENNIKRSQVISRMKPISNGAPVLWEYVARMIDDAVHKGFLAE